MTIHAADRDLSTPYQDEWSAGFERQMEASYTWSKVRGDAEDFDLLLSNEANLREDEAGFLDFEQRHAVRVKSIWRPASGWRLNTSV